jgi:hypothetical protein
MWRMWRTFGLPHGGGWLSERQEALQAITIVEEERTYFDHRKAEERRDKHGNS